MDILKFQNDLLNWYALHKRDLPWRKTNNPYYIWISEIMLQQTQVQTVIPYYEHFIQTFPTISSLATASLEDVYKCWEGLGYYSRAKNLQVAAKTIIEKYNGIFPNKYETILELKGIGPYTASAISSIAFNIPKGVVDGNVLRIFSRLYNDNQNIALDKTKKEYQTLCDTLISKDDPSSFNQALMDLGATICKPKHPLCENCPVQSHCQAYIHKKQLLLPVNIKKLKHTDIHYITCIIEYDNKYFLIKNKEGLLSDLYGLIQYNVESVYSFEEKFKEEYNEEIEVTEFYKEVKHVFSHRTWRMQVYKARFLKQPNLKLYNFQEMNLIPIATAHKKIIQNIEKN